MADLSNIRDNDQAKSAGLPKAGPPADSENNPTRITPGVGGTDDSDQATPEAKRAGYGYSSAGPNNSPMGGHNINERNQYTVKLPRGSSI